MAVLSVAVLVAVLEASANQRGIRVLPATQLRRVLPQKDLLQLQLARACDVLDSILELEKTCQRFLLVRDLPSLSFPSV